LGSLLDAAAHGLRNVAGIQLTIVHRDQQSWTRR
jgi:hypothetical protein